MKFSRKLLFIGAVSFLMASCADESPWGSNETQTGSGHGKINLNLSSTNEVSTGIPKTKAVSTTVVAPPTSAFQIRLSKADGSYTRTWSSVEEFAKEDKFPVGVYDLEAFYGDPESQGVLTAYSKGYEYAYYYGKTENITVLEGEETPVTISARLNNSIVLVEYTDAFKAYFTDWSTTLKTSGKTDVEIGNREATSYVKPGDVDIVIDATLQNGKTLFLNPAAFEAEPQHMYKIKYNIHDGNVDYKTLVISFDDDPSGETDIFIDLTDDVINAEAPVITAQGFKNGEEIETQVGVPLQNSEIKMSVIARGGIKAATLKVVSNPPYSSTFLNNSVIDLCQATPEQQTAMMNAGIKARGFFDNPGEMAYLDLTEFCKSLPQGSHEISLMVTDKFGNANKEEMKVTITTVPTNAYIMEDAQVMFGEEYVDVKVSYDGPDPTIPGNNPFSFTMILGSGMESPAGILGIGSVENPLSRANYVAKEYVYRLQMPAEGADEYPIRMYFNNGNNAIGEPHKVVVNYPEYTLEYDALAKKIRMRIETVKGQPIDETTRAKFTERLRVFVDDTETSVSKIDGIIFLDDNFAPANNYNIKTTLQKKDNPDVFSNVDIVTTETENQLPNQDWSSRSQTININPIDVGSKYNVTVVMIPGTYQNTSSISVFEAENWSSINSKTCSSLAQTNNTWFKVPSTILTGDIYTVRTVGYSHEALTLSTSGGQMNRNYYGETTPERSQLNIVPGELFLGSYSYTQSGENRIDGIDFSTRPSALSFKYSYMSREGETAYVRIAVKDENDETIAQGFSSLTNTASAWKFDESTLEDPDGEYYTVDLSEYPFGKKAKKIEICFLSTDSNDPAIYIPQGSELNEGVTTTGFTSERGRTIDTNKYHAYSKGSVLRVSDVKVTY